MPALPVPLTAKVSGFFVQKTSRSMVCSSAMMAQNSGSRWPSSGVVIALSTRG